MSLIDQTYFTNEIQIPSSKYETIQSFIDRYEKQVLIDLFGYGLYKLIKDYDPLTSEQRITDIIKGKDFTLNGFEARWNGLINEDKVSLIAYYVYFKWASEKQVISTRAAGIKPALENGENVSYELKAIAAYNMMMQLYGHRSQDSNYPSAFRFMTENHSIYPEWQFTPKGLLNMFAL